MSLKATLAYTNSLTAAPAAHGNNMVATLQYQLSKKASMVMGLPHPAPALHFSVLNAAGATVIVPASGKTANGTAMYVTDRGFNGDGVEFTILGA